MHSRVHGYDDYKVTHLYNLVAAVVSHRIKVVEELYIINNTDTKYSCVQPMYIYAKPCHIYAMHTSHIYMKGESVVMVIRFKGKVATNKELELKFNRIVKLK